MSLLAVHVRGVVLAVSMENVVKHIKGAEHDTLLPESALDG